MNTGFFQFESSEFGKFTGNPALVCATPGLCRSPDSAKNLTANNDSYDYALAA
jgi:hypothetical protein